jgi:cytochrome P450
MEPFAAAGRSERFSNRNALVMPLPPAAIRDRMPRYPFATGLLMLDDPEHRPARKLVQAPFTPKRLRAIEPVVRRRAEELLRPGDEHRRLEFVHEYGVPLALTVIGSILGVPEEDFPRCSDPSRAPSGSSVAPAARRRSWPSPRTSSPIGTTSGR